MIDTAMNTVMVVIRDTELIVEWFLWTMEDTNRSLNTSIQCSTPSPGIQEMQFV